MLQKIWTAHFYATASRGKSSPLGHDHPEREKPLGDPQVHHPISPQMLALNITSSARPPLFGAKSKNQTTIGKGWPIGFFEVQKPRSVEVGTYTNE